TVDIERGLGFLRGDEVVALLVVLVERRDGVTGSLVGEAAELVDLGAQAAAILEPIELQPTRRDDVAHLELVAVRVIRHDERGVLRAEEVRPAGAGHVRDREIRRQPGRGTALVSSDRAEAWVEADESPAADRDTRRGTGHHVVV